MGSGCIILKPVFVALMDVEAVGIAVRGHDLPPKRGWIDVSHKLIIPVPNDKFPH
jgi:hypothetical protein